MFQKPKHKTQLNTKKQISETKSTLHDMISKNDKNLCRVYLYWFPFSLGTFNILYT